MSDKPKYVIEKNVPLPEPRGRKLYEYHDIPFDQMEVGDCVSIAFKNLIPHNSHPDVKRKASRSKQYDELPEKESFLIGNSRQDKTSRCLIVAHSQVSKQKTKEYNLNRCFRIWRTN
jgi:hypothetical protein